MRYFLLILVTLPLTVFGQNTLTLSDCYEQAAANDPTAGIPAVNEQMTENNLQNLSTNHLPKVSFTAQASYQSDVPGFDLNIPNIELPMPQKDQYNAYIDVNQTIFDGGTTKASRQVESTQLAANQQQQAVSLYELHNQVNQFYFGALRAQEQVALIKVQFKELDNQMHRIDAGIENGVVLPSAHKSLEAEKLKASQMLLQARNQQQTALDLLGRMIGQELDTSTELEQPDLTVTALDPSAASRPELSLFSDQKQVNLQRQDALQAQRMPKLGAYVRGGYGRPGLNPFETSFQPYYLAGIQVTWDIIDWSKSQRERENLQLANHLIDMQQSAFNQQLELQLAGQYRDIQSLEDILEKDQQIIALRKDIVQTAADQQAQGVITATEYITELNAQTKAQQEEALHRVQLLQAKVQYYTVLGTIDQQLNR